MPEGEIIKLVRHRGFGFVDSENIANIEGDIFFHHSSLEDAYFEDLKTGDVLSFEVTETPKGPEAVKITKQVNTDLGLEEEPKEELSEEVGEDTVEDEVVDEERFEEEMGLESDLEEDLGPEFEEDEVMY